MILKLKWLYSYNSPSPSMLWTHVATRVNEKYGQQHCQNVQFYSTIQTQCWNWFRNIYLEKFQSIRRKNMKCVFLSLKTAQVFSSASINVLETFSIFVYVLMIMTYSWISDVETQLMATVAYQSCHQYSTFVSYKDQMSKESKRFKEDFIHKGKHKTDLNYAIHHEIFMSQKTWP